MEEKFRWLDVVEDEIVPLLYTLSRLGFYEGFNIYASTHKNKVVIEYNLGKKLYLEKKKKIDV